MKLFAICALFALLFTSCFTYKNISRKDPITNDFLAKLKPGKKYQFTLKTGQTLMVHLTSIDGETINGFYRLHGVKDKIDYSAT
ncbi:MAG TPA: hypothetical protein VK666_07315, partial [Chryseolinea sp.]|nr:hypothetical protein [Chryseolinea sp.]